MSEARPMPAAWPLKEAAKQLGISDRKLRSLIRDGEIRASRCGRLWLVQPDAIREYLAAVEQGGNAY